MTRFLSYHRADCENGMSPSNRKLHSSKDKINTEYLEMTRQNKHRNVLYVFLFWAIFFRKVTGSICVSGMLFTYFYIFFNSTIINATFIILDYDHLGCYEVNENVENLLEEQKNGINNIAECAQVVREKRFSHFSIFYQRSCFSGPRCGLVLDVTNPSGSCDNNRGSNRAVDLFKFKSRTI